jgi:hypothetical protein
MISLIKKIKRKTSEVSRVLCRRLLGMIFIAMTLESAMMKRSKGGGIVGPR